MLAAWYERNGPAAEVLQVGKMEPTEPGPGEIRIRLHASGLNPSDVKSRAGTTRKIAHPRVVPNSDGAGVVEKVGPGVARFAPGQRVWCFNGQWARAFGTSAQSITLPAAQVARLPEGLDFAQGACLGIPVMTAYRCLFADGPISGQQVLVTGGAGVVGHYAVQLAKWAGAKVIATVSSDAKAEHARKAGADHLVNYRTERVAERVKALGGVDRVVDVDLGANLADSLAVLRPNGVLAGYASMGKPVLELPFYGHLALNVTLRVVLVYTMPDTAKAAAVADIERWAKAGRPQFAIARRFPLAEAVAAHEFVERGDKIGHVVLDIS
ncbi:MAG TPA: NADPH:quinone reductase [Burkholderiales bacterium]